MIWYLASDRTMTSTKGHQNMRTFCSVTISHPLRHPVDTSLRLHSWSWPLVWTRFELPSLFMSESYYPCAILCCKLSHSASLYFSGFSVFFWLLCVCVHALLLVCFSTVHCYIYTLISIHPHIKFIYFLCLVSAWNRFWSTLPLLPSWHRRLQWSFPWNPHWITHSRFCSPVCAASLAMKSCRHGLMHKRNIWCSLLIHEYFLLFWCVNY